MKKDAFYFSHDSNARNDEKILQMRAKYGYEGYGIYWALIEIMRDSSDTKLSIKNVNAIAIGINISEKKLLKFIESCIKEFSLFVLKDGKFYSNRLLKQVRLVKQISCKRSAIALQRHLNESKVKESKSNKIKLNNTGDIPLVNLKNNIQNNTEYTTEELFEYIWQEYPKRDGKKSSLRNFNATIKNENDFLDLCKSVNNYLQTDTVRKGYIKNGSTFFNNWKDFIEPSTNGFHKIKDDLEPEKF